MDIMGTGDIYFSYLSSDKTHEDTETNIILPSEAEGSLEPIETMFADIIDGNLAWTVDGYSEQTNIKTSSQNIEVTASPIVISNEPLILEVNDQFDDNNSTDTTKDPIINCTDTVLKNIAPNILRNCRSILKHPALENVKIADEIEEVTAFNCKKCGFLCRVRQELVDHIQTIHLGKNRENSHINVNPKTVNIKLDSMNEEIISVVYLCGICGKVGYNSQEHLKQHMIDIHEVEESDNKSEHNSSNEETASKSENNILKNYQIFVQNQHKNASKIRCSVEFCESRFASEEFKLLHGQCHCDYPYPNNNNGDNIDGPKSLQDYRYKCTECEARFVLWRTCSSHLWSRHRIDTGLFSCPLCAKFKSISANGVLTHLSSIHLSTNHPTTTTKPCLCNVCGARYKSLAQLRIHLKRAHASPTSPDSIITYKCPTCQRIFATIHSLRKHEQAHAKTNVFECAACDYRTARKDTMERHLRGHTGEKPYKCQLCGFRSGDHNTVRRHQMRHSGKSSYTCPYCTYTAIQSSSYKKHLMRNHPGKGVLFTCPICCICFLRQSVYTAHMRDHRMGLVQSPLIVEAEDDLLEISSLEPTIQKTLPLVSILRCPSMSTRTVDCEQQVYFDAPAEGT